MTLEIVFKTNYDMWSSYSHVGGVLLPACFTEAWFSFLIFLLWCLRTLAELEHCCVIALTAKCL